MLRYRISLIECGIDDPGEQYGYQTQLVWGDESWEDCVQFGLTEADAKALVEWVKYSEECEG